MLTDAVSDFAGSPVTLVPTMGALHEGHVSLVRTAARLVEHRGSGQVVVSIFVNPTQFNEDADYRRYPRDTEVDAAMAFAAGADVVWAPALGAVYPPGAEVPVGDLPAVATRPGLEDRFRPGHFEGVVQVVRRLFAMTEPVAAVFGEKDWQQLQVVRAMVAAESLGVEIVGGPTVREADGLAMASRNVFLSPEERAAAVAVPRAIAAARAAGDPLEAERVMRAEIEAAGLEVEYAVVRDAADLMEPRAGDMGRAMRAVVTARAGATRLLDNGPFGETGVGGGSRSSATLGA